MNNDVDLVYGTPFYYSTNVIIGEWACVFLTNDMLIRARNSNTTKNFATKKYSMINLVGCYCAVK